MKRRMETILNSTHRLFKGNITNPIDVFGI